MNIFLVYGGKSAEHDVSLNSASSFVSGIDFNYYTVTLVYITKEGNWMKGPKLTEAVSEQDKFKLNEQSGWESQSITCGDLYDEESIVFPLLHGPNGEDGSIQGMLKVINMPYIGPGVVPCAVGLDKILSKNLFSKAGLQQLPAVSIDRYKWKKTQQDVIDEVEESLTYPVYIKPANLGSSIGISEATDSYTLKKGIDHAFEYDRRVIVEQGVKARELEIAVLGNEIVETSIVGEIIKEPGFFDYEDKYETKSYKEKYPAELSEEQIKQITDDAVKGFKAIDGNGMARIDFFVTETNDIYLNEINLIPGFSRDSVFSRLWNETGLPYEEMIEKIIQLGLERAAVTEQLTKTDR